MHSVPGLAQSRRLATLALLTACTVWVVSLLLKRLFPAFHLPLEILAMAAEAGVVGGLADWYAVTVLFHNPFGKLPLPRLLRDHTEIIPRNKTRIAESMGRFVQENFLAPAIVERSLKQMDLSLLAADWLNQQEHLDQIGSMIRRAGPRVIQVFESRDMEQFIQQNIVEWIRNTPLNQLSSEFLSAILDNDFHEEALQKALDAANRWVKANPDKAYALARRIFEELGVGGLARGASFIGIDIQQRIIDTLMTKVNAVLTEADHPWRKGFEGLATRWMIELRDPESSVSRRLNGAKDTLTHSEALINFMGTAIGILRNAVKHNLEQPDSSLARNIQDALQRLARHLQDNAAVREALNHEIITGAVIFTTDYSGDIIRYVSDRIHEWDTRDMIAKIESEVGGDLHMIRVNGVVVGAFIGLILGIIRAVIG